MLSIHDFNSSIAAMSAIQQWANLHLIAQGEDPEYTPPDPVPAGDIYYFAEDGDDDTGTKNNIGSPFQTLDKLKELIPTLSAGDGVLFAMGDTFKYTTSEAVYEYFGYHQSMVSGTELQPIIFSRYWKTGDEANTTLPILTGEVTETLTWTQQADIAGEPKNIWKATGKSGVGKRTMRDGVEVGNCETFDEFTDNPEQLMWWVSDEIWYKSDDNKATLDASVWTYSNQKYLFNIEYTDHVIFNGLDTRWTRGGGCDINMWLVSNVTIQNCKMGLYSSGGSTLTGAWTTRGVGNKCWYNIYDTGWRLDYSFDYISSSDGVGLHNLCQFNQFADGVIAEYNQFIDFGHVALTTAAFTLDENDNRSDGAKFRYNYFRAYNSAYARPMGGAGEYSNMEIAYNWLEGCSTRCQIGGKNTHWHHNIFKDWQICNKDTGSINNSESSPIYDYPENSFPSTHIIENNLFYNMPTYGIRMARITNNNIVRNNIFVDVCKELSGGIYRGMGVYIEPWSTSDPSTYNGTMSNNLFYDSTIATGHIAVGGGNTDTGLIDSFSVTQVTADTTYDWVSHQDNLEDDPLFIDTTEFRIPVTSPANDTGLDPTAIEDYDGVSITYPYNIGLYNTEEGTQVNPYLEVFTIPEYTGAPDQFLIETNSDWSHINDSQYTNFYVTAGNYKSLGNITLNVSGTESKRRTISLYDPSNHTDDRHPAKMLDSEVAQYLLHFAAAEWWVVDRMCCFDGASYVIKMYEGSEHNVINRMHTKHVSHSVTVMHTAHNNTFQNGRFDNMTDYPDGYDGPVCIQLATWDTHYGQIWNTKIINNEFYNQNDGVQLVRGPVDGYTTLYQDNNFEGTIIDSNKFTKDIAFMENAMDFKCGSDNPNNPVIVSNNVMWGYNRHPDYIWDPDNPNSYPPGITAIVCHHNPKNVHFIDNIFFDNYVGLGAGAGDGDATGFYLSLIDSRVNNNIFYDSGNIAYDEQPFQISSHKNTNADGNYIIAPRIEDVIYTHSSYDSPAQNSLAETKIVAPLNGTWDIVGDNIVPWTTTYAASLATTYEMDRTNFTDYKFTWGAFGNTPEVITLTQVLDPNGTIVSPL